MVFQFWSLPLLVVVCVLLCHLRRINAFHQAPSALSRTTTSCGRRFVIGSSTPLDASVTSTASLENHDSVKQQQTASMRKTPAVSSSPPQPQLEQKLAFRRAREIGIVLLADVFVPLVASLARSGGSSHGNGGGINLWSKGANAERVCQALETLGPTYVKFGQALASRADIIPPSLADALLRLQDDMTIFPTSAAQEIIQLDLKREKDMSSDKVNALLASLSLEPVAAASIGQVYKGHIEGHGEVAVKVKRPGIHEIVARDAALLKTAATWVESLPGWKSDKLIAARVVDAVDEFMARIFEELDYRREVDNMKTFGDLYSIERGTCKHVKVVVPNPVEDYCTDNVIVMEWINGTKLDGFENADPIKRKQDLKVVEMGIACTLSQLLETGKLHADPHLGNLQRVDTPEGVKLGYLDFGLLATVPESVRDGLVCAVVQLIFARNVKAVAALFGELQLLPPEVMENPQKMNELIQELDRVFTAVLQFPDDQKSQGRVPTVRFDNLLGGLTSLVARFQLTLPPYFLNNARALATLEGVAIRLDPSFNVLKVVYPFALNRVLSNPSMSTIIIDTTMDLLRNPHTGLVEISRARDVVTETARLSQRSRRRVVIEVLTTSGGRKLSRLLARAVARQRWAKSRVRKVLFRRKGSLI